MPFVNDRGFAEIQIRKKWNWPYPLNRIEYFDELQIKMRNFAYTLISTNPGDCKISFSINGGFAEVQVLKKWKLPITLKP